MDYSNTVNTNMLFNPTVYSPLGYPNSATNSLFPSWNMSNTPLSSTYASMIGYPSFDTNSLLSYSNMSNTPFSGAKQNVSGKALSETDEAKIVIENLVYNGKKTATDNWDLPGQGLMAAAFGGISGIYNALAFGKNFKPIIENAQKLAGRNDYLYQMKNLNLMVYPEYQRKFRALRSFGNAITKLEKNLKAVGVLDASGNPLMNAAKYNSHIKQIDALNLAKGEMQSLVNEGKTITQTQLQNLEAMTSDLNKAKGSVKRVSRFWRFLKGDYKPTRLIKEGFEGVNKSVSGASKAGGIFKIFKGAGALGALFAVGMEVMCEWENIKAAKEIGPEAEKKQWFKSGVKAIVSAGAWTAGAATGAMIGTMIGGPVGTVLGLGFGMAIGGLFSTASKKLVKHFITGEDEYVIAKEKQEKEKENKLVNNPKVEAEKARNELIEKATKEEKDTGTVSDETAQALQASIKLADAAGVAPLVTDEGAGNIGHKVGEQIVSNQFDPYSLEGRAFLNTGYQPFGFNSNYGYGSSPYMAGGSNPYLMGMGGGSSYMAGGSNPYLMGMGGGSSYMAGGSNPYMMGMGGSSLYMAGGSNPYMMGMGGGNPYMMG